MQLCPSTATAHSKTLFQLRKTEAILASAPASDPEADARLEREAKQEEKSIYATCDSLGLQMFEVRSVAHINGA